jgi:hypothetical protein
MPQDLGFGTSVPRHHSRQLMLKKKGIVPVQAQSPGESRIPIVGQANKDA